MFSAIFFGVKLKRFSFYVAMVRFGFVKVAIILSASIFSFRIRGSRKRVTAGKIKKILEKTLTL